MATKLRSFSRSRLTKFIAFTLVVISIIVFLLELLDADKKNLSMESLYVENYDESQLFENEIRWAFNEAIELMENRVDIINAELSYLYYITNGEKTYSNAALSKILENEKYHYSYSGGKWNGERIYAIYDQVYYGENYAIDIAFTEEHMQQKQVYWDESKTELTHTLIIIGAAIVIALAGIIYLMVVTGRNSEDNEIHLTQYTDRIYSDIGLGIFIFTLMLWGWAVNSMVYYYRFYSYNEINNIEMQFVNVVIAIITGITTIICGLFLLSFVRKMKAKKLLKHSLLYAILIGFSHFIKSFFDDSRYEHYPLTKSLNRRQVIFTVSSGFMVFITFVFMVGAFHSLIWLLPIMIEGLIIFWYFHENNKTFVEINQGFQSSIQEQMKSERMKVDLITNVSHDLKTPLTSIISYVDLLSKEDLPESAHDYVNILADKSARLKNIVSDLFDLAKSTSGNLSLDMERLDLVKLIEQTLGDMEDEIERSDIRIKTTLSELPINIYSDGKKLYRVFQNIIGNALKYSLLGTRVFIDMETVNNVVSVTIKNTASYDMDFTADDVLQRFVRGDASRSTEGSGLGLSIAESFTWACGGSFKVDIDGDLFKVRLEFPMMA